jgi:uncharacterized membrane protein SirB2
MALADHYLLIKAAHVGLAMLSGGLFAGRGVGVLLGAEMPMLTPVRRLSQVIDTALLAAALLLLATLQLNPFATPWLLTKLMLLVAYIVLGTMALRRARTLSGQGTGVCRSPHVLPDDVRHRQDPRPAGIPAARGPVMNVITSTA